MHGSTRDRLEELLAARRVAAADSEVREHLSSCPECSSELEAMKNHADLLQLLRSPEEVDPPAGFYARTMQRIEEQAKGSIWSVFIYSPFGKRLVFASLTVAVALGTYVVTQESRDGHLRGVSVIAQGFHDDAVVEGDQAQQRDAVLANFASHPVTGQAVSQEGLLR
jgi:anti-sigma factor RsiW